MSKQIPAWMIAQIAKIEQEKIISSQIPLYIEVPPPGYVPPPKKES